MDQNNLEKKLGTNQNPELIDEKKFITKTTYGTNFSDTPDGYEMIGFDRTSTHKTNDSYYAKKESITPEELTQYLKSNAKQLGGSDAIFEINANKKDITIYTASKGGWIGAKGRWINALNRVLVEKGKVYLSDKIVSLEVNENSCVPKRLKEINKYDEIIKKFENELKGKNYGHQKETIKEYKNAHTEERYYLKKEDEKWLQDWLTKLNDYNKNLAEQKIINEENERKQYFAEYNEIQTLLGNKLPYPGIVGNNAQRMQHMRNTLQSNDNYREWLVAVLNNCSARSIQEIFSDKILLSDCSSYPDEFREQFEKFGDIEFVKSYTSEDGMVYLWPPQTLDPGRKYVSDKEKKEIHEQTKNINNIEEQNVNDVLKVIETLPEVKQFTKKQREELIVVNAIIKQLIVLPGLRCDAYGTDYGEGRIALEKNNENNQYNLQVITCNEKGEIKKLSLKGYRSSKLNEVKFATVTEALKYFNNLLDENSKNIDYKMLTEYKDKDYKASDYSKDYIEYVKKLLQK